MSENENSNGTALDKSLLEIMNSKSAGTIVVFDKGEFYTVYEDDARLLLNDVFRTELGLRSATFGPTNRKLVYVNVNCNQYQRVIRELLLVLHYRVELYKQDEKCWTMVAKGSMGNLADFEEVIGDTVELTDSSIVVAIKVDWMGLDVDRDRESDDVIMQINVALAFCDTQNFVFTLAQFGDTAHFSHLEACLAAMGPGECIVAGRAETFSSTVYSRVQRRLNDILKRSNIGCHFLDPSQFSSTSLDRHLQTLLKTDHIDHCGYGRGELSEAMCCVRALIDYLQLLTDDTNEHKFSVATFSPKSLLRLDSTVIDALELFNTSYVRSNEGTLFDTLNKCRSLPGQRKLRQWIRQPLKNLRQIKERHDVVEALVTDSGRRNLLRDDLLRRVPDLALLARRLARRKATLQDCYRLYQMVQLLGRFMTVLEELVDDDMYENGSSIRDLLFEPLRMATANFDNFSGLVETGIDLDHLETTQEFRVRPDLDEALSGLSARMRQIAEQMQFLAAKASQTLAVDGEKTVKVENSNQYGFCFRVSRKDEKAIRNSENFEVIDATSAGVRFSNDRVRRLNEEYDTVKAEYGHRQQTLIQQLLNTASTFCESVLTLTDVISTLDVLVSFASTATAPANTYVRPHLLETGRRVLKLKGCRHAGLELLDTFIANDVQLSFEEGRRMLIVTGPNMGGKSTYLRSVALTVLMGQIGSLVPCDSAEYSLIDCLLTRVGACDYQERGVSTFMAEMQETGLLLESATENSLVIVDELGRGTSTYDGFGLAAAVAQELNEVGCFCLLATHFHELTVLAAEEWPRAQNVRTQCLTDNRSLTLLYRIVPGSAESSFGIHVARIARFPDEIIQRALTKLSELEKEKRDDIDKLKKTEREQLRQTILDIRC